MGGPEDSLLILLDIFPESLLNLLRFDGYLSPFGNKEGRRLGFSGSSQNSDNSFPPPPPLATDPEAFQKLDNEDTVEFRESLLPFNDILR